MLTVAFLVAVVVLPILYGAFGPVSRRYVDRFLGRYPIRMTADNGPMVVRRLARVRAARTLGGLGGALFGVGASAMGLRVNLLLAIAVGYLLGAVVAETPSRRDRVASSRPAASLVPRRLSDYVPRWLVISPFVIIALTLLLYVGVAVGAQRRDVAADATWHGPAGIGAMALAALLMMVTARMILHRRQPYTSPEMVSADDALRGASLHCVCGGGFAIVAVIGSGLLWNAATRSDVQALRWIAPWLAAVLSIAAIFAWFTARVGPWLVRRPYESIGRPFS